MKSAIVISAAIILISTGCQPQASNSTAAAPAPAPAAPAPISTPATRIGGLELNPLETRATPAAAPQSAPAAPAPASQQPAADAAPKASTPPTAPAAPNSTQVKAQAGVAQKGKSLEQHSGVIVEPLKAFIRFEQKAVYDIQIPQAMQLFNASEGRKPNSQEEFMSKIITANNIQLPKLPAGHRYIYNVEKGELMVERPAN